MSTINNNQYCKPTQTGWQKDGTFIKRIPNATVFFTANKQGDKWLLLKGKAGWGEFYNSLEEIQEYLKEFKEKNSPVYWSSGYDIHTSPYDHLFDTVNEVGNDWVKVELEVYLNKIEII